MAAVSVKKVYFVNTQISAAALIKLFYVKVRLLIDHLRFAFSWDFIRFRLQVV